MITDIHLQHFRSYTDASFDFKPGVNIIVGPNTSGKTNLLEAVLIIASGSSYRGDGQELIEFGYNFTRIEAHTPNGSRVVKIELESNRAQKLFEINSQKFKRLGMTRTVPAVVFQPDHLRQLIGSPESRRNFVDDLLAQTITGFSKLRSDYRRALAQRNTLLRNSSKTPTPLLFVWDVRLSSLGGQIAQLRLKLLDSINAQLGKIYQSISSTKDSTELSYKTSCDSGQYETTLLRKLKENVDTDLQRGFTAHGPHRDDILIMLDGHPISEIASRGEVRSLLLSLKVIEARLIEDSRGVPPLLLLDDVFSELDGARRRSLTKYLQNYQTFITTTDADIVLHHFTEECNVIATQPD